MTFRHEDVALEFARWLSPVFAIWCNDRIKELVRHGMTATPQTVERILNDPGTMIGVLQELKREREKTARQSAKIESDRPKVLFAESVEASQRSILVGEMAKILKQNGVEIGQNRMFQWMRKEGWLGNYGDYYNVPTQKAMEHGYFEIKKNSVVKPDGCVLVTSTPKVTGKGQIYFTDRFLNEKEAAASNC